MDAHADLSALLCCNFVGFVVFRLNSAFSLGYQLAKTKFPSPLRSHFRETDGRRFKAEDLQRSCHSENNWMKNLYGPNFLKMRPGV